MCSCHCSDIQYIGWNYINLESKGSENETSLPSLYIYFFSFMFSHSSDPSRWLCSTRPAVNPCLPNWDSESSSPTGKGAEDGDKQEVKERDKKALGK